MKMIKTQILVMAVLLAMHSTNAQTPLTLNNFNITRPTLTLPNIPCQSIQLLGVTTVVVDPNNNVKGSGTYSSVSSVFADGEIEADSQPLIIYVMPGDYYDSFDVNRDNVSILAHPCHPGDVNFIGASPLSDWQGIFEWDDDETPVWERLYDGNSQLGQLANVSNGNCTFNFSGDKDGIQGNETSLWRTTIPAQNGQLYAGGHPELRNTQIWKKDNVEGKHRQMFNYKTLCDVGGCGGLSFESRQAGGWSEQQRKFYNETTKVYEISTDFINDCEGFVDDGGSYVTTNETYFKREGFYIQGINIMGNPETEKNQIVEYHIYLAIDKNLVEEYLNDNLLISRDGAMVLINNKQNITIDGGVNNRIKFKYSGQYAIIAKYQTSDIKLKNLNFQDVTNGISFWVYGNEDPITNIKISDCNFKHNLYVNYENLVWADVKIQPIEHSAITCWSSANVNNDQPTYQNLVIKNNIIDGYFNAIQVLDGEAFIEGNRITNGDDAIELEGYGRNVYCYNNFIKDNSTAFSMYAIEIGPTYIYDNNVVIDKVDLLYINPCASTTTDAVSCGQNSPLKNRTLKAYSVFGNPYSIGGSPQRISNNAHIYYNTFVSKYIPLNIDIGTTATTGGNQPTIMKTIFDYNIYNNIFYTDQDLVVAGTGNYCAGNTLKGNIFYSTSNNPSINYFGASGNDAPVDDNLFSELEAHHDYLSNNSCDSNGSGYNDLMEDWGDIAFEKALEKMGLVDVDDLTDCGYIYDHLNGFDTSIAGLVTTIMNLAPNSVSTDYDTFIASCRNINDCISLLVDTYEVMFKIVYNHIDNQTNEVWSDNTFQSIIFAGGADIAGFENVEDLYLTQDPNWCNVAIPHLPVNLEYLNSKKEPGANPLSKSVPGHLCITLPKLNQAKSNYIQIYPNPASEQVRVNFTHDKLEINSIKVYNLMGEEIQVVKLITDQSTALLNVGTLVNGVYLLKIITNGQETHTQKLTIAH